MKTFLIPAIALVALQLLVPAASDAVPPGDATRLAGTWRSGNGTMALLDLEPQGADRGHFGASLRDTSCARPPCGEELVSGDFEVHGGTLSLALRGGPTMRFRYAWRGRDLVLQSLQTPAPAAQTLERAPLVASAPPPPAAGGPGAGPPAGPPGGCVVPSTTAPRPSGPSVVAGQAEVIFRAVPQVRSTPGGRVAVQWSSTNAVLARFGATGLHAVFEPPYDAVARAHALDRSFVIDVPAATDVDALVRALRADPHVESASPEATASTEPMP